MVSDEIKALRKSGNLEEAYRLAKSEYEAAPENIWNKRNLSWVYYDLLKNHINNEEIKDFFIILENLKELQLDSDETMFFDNISFQLGKMCFKLLKKDNNITFISQILEFAKSCNFTKPSTGYSFLFKALHKGLKETGLYLDFAEWWDFNNFMPEDFKPETLQGKEIMSIAEQAYIAYAKHLLPKRLNDGSINFEKEKARNYIITLSNLETQHPQYQFPAYFQAKLLLALGEDEDAFSSLIPFVKKKRNEFWAWSILSEAFKHDEDKVLACLCRALLCKSPNEMLPNVRHKTARILVKREKYPEAKTEIELIVKAKTIKGNNIPSEILNWQRSEWYNKAVANDSNNNFYRSWSHLAENILFSEEPEELAYISFVNSNKKMLNFICSEKKYGFLKYEGFLQTVTEGDILKIRFQNYSSASISKAFTIVKTNDDDFKKKFEKFIDGKILIAEGNSYGFIDDIFVPPNIIVKNNLVNGVVIKGKAIYSFNKASGKWGWKLVAITP